jgi:hypothetical protein
MRPKLSGKRQQVYIDEENKQLLFSVAGTRSGTDIYNDLRLATGGLKNTNRFKSADKTLKDAKNYTRLPTTTIVSSLGGSIAGRLGGANDRRITYNAGEVGVGTEIIPLKYAITATLYRFWGGFI